MKTERALVIGGINLDILGYADHPFQSMDSIPGHIIHCPGGVGRNIAEGLKGCGLEVCLLSAVGEDVEGAFLKESCLKLGIDLRYLVTFPGPSPCYLAIHDEKGDMRAAVNQMDALKQLEEKHLQKVAEDQADFNVCVLDSNLEEELLQSAASFLRIPLIADPVSCEKAIRLKPILGPTENLETR